MEKQSEIKKLIGEINFRNSNSKDYKKMRVEEISKELKDVMRFEQDSFKKKSKNLKKYKIIQIW